ncbi:SDR family oxidoreductase [Occultella glacieicola]|uniref:SDR family oxidoreductase n=1 Tax=Occultella glacieicola TaxID=2518684 RepID=A0ABY2E6Q9_9MICO|nr:SDR family NAD(P)-dependent oxidoreductase [Occultella glacieicola]TDE94963.1 SDR family oxidoreductase [Occultella glacieicola]
MGVFPTERTAVITGAGSARGIGRATAHRLAAEGWSLGLLDIDGPAVEALATELSQRHEVAAVGLRVDVSDPADVRTAVGKLETELPPLVALANVAGVSSPVPYLDLPDEEWTRVMRVNLDGVHYVSKRVAESMAGRRLGRIVSISSVSAQRGGGTYSKTPYSVAKAGVIGLTRALARELGPHGITVNAICPGPIDTDIMGGTLSEERKRELVADLLVDRVGTTEDIAAAISFLLGPDAGYITGQTLNVDGGLYMH